MGADKNGGGRRCPVGCIRGSKREEETRGG